jgi:hypothetical protein
MATGFYGTAKAVPFVKSIFPIFLNPHQSEDVVARLKPGPLCEDFFPPTFKARAELYAALSRLWTGHRITIFLDSMLICDILSFK